MKSIQSLVEDTYIIESVVKATRKVNVYRASNKSSGAPAIVKIYTKNHHYSDSFYEAEVRFHKACAGIAGIPTLLSAGEEEDGKYLITEYVGCSLAELIAANKRLPGTSFQLLARYLLVLLQAIHERGFLYLNFAPENILIDPPSRISLIDFKYAVCYSDLGENAVDSPSVRSALFESTDRLLGRAPGFRSDIESLVYVLMYLETGTLPWRTKRTNEADSFQSIIHSRRRLHRSTYFRGLSEQLARLWNYTMEIDLDAQPHYELLKNIFRKSDESIIIEDYVDDSPKLHRGWSLDVEGITREPLPPTRKSDVPYSYGERSDLEDSLRNEARKRTAQKEGPELTPNLRLFISQLREERDY